MLLLDVGGKNYPNTQDRKSNLDTMSDSKYIQ